MTLIASWAATDDKPKGKRVSAVYFCADSRFSWPLNGKVYDMGKKVYVCSSFPEMFCFCGDVEFPTITLQSLITEIDLGLLFDVDSPFAVKESVIADYLSQSLVGYPKAVLAKRFSIYYASCIRKHFFITSYCYGGESIIVKGMDLPSESSKVFSAGSGKDLFEKLWIEANKPSVNEQFTSRNVYNCFIRALDEARQHSEDDGLSKVGGAPQLAGLYRNGKPRLYGIIRHGERFVQGRNVQYKPCMNNIEWRNDKFERVDPQTMELKTGAQPQPFAPRIKGK